MILQGEEKSENSLIPTNHDVRFKKPTEQSKFYYESGTKIFFLVRVVLMIFFSKIFNLRGKVQMS